MGWRRWGEGGLKDTHQGGWRVGGIVCRLMQTLATAGVVTATVGQVFHAAEASLRW